MRPSRAIAKLERLLAALPALATELEHAATGEQVWRVAGPDGAYAIEFNSFDVMNPKAECELWIHEHAAYAAERGYTVQKARAFTQHELTMRLVAERLRALVVD